jgi:hypothetical protein
MWQTTVRHNSIQLRAGDLLQVTWYLKETLPYIVKHCETGFLWIDQICINQDDLLKKNHQVSVMRNIYSSCASVIVWLGKLIMPRRGSVDLEKVVLCCNTARQYSEIGQYLHNKPQITVNDSARDLCTRHERLKHTSSRPRSHKDLLVSMVVAGMGFPRGRCCSQCKSGSWPTPYVSRRCCYGSLGVVNYNNAISQSPTQR